MWSCRWSDMKLEQRVRQVLHHSQLRPVIEKKKMNFTQMLDSILENEVQGFVIADVHLPEHCRINHHLSWPALYVQFSFHYKINNIKLNTNRVHINL